jgi:hypothetical protein
MPSFYSVGIPFAAEPLPLIMPKRFNAGERKVYSGTTNAIEKNHATRSTRTIDHLVWDYPTLHWFAHFRLGELRSNAVPGECNERTDE